MQTIDAGTASMTGMAQVRCNDCSFYYITHDAAFPYGCRALVFKSRNLPSREVLAASGQPCRLFEAR